LDELRSRRDDFASQLSRLSIASLGGGLAGESSASILDDLRRAAPAEQRERLLWQSRLILSLAAMQAEEQEDLRSELERINARRRSMLDELKKDWDHEQALPREPKEMESIAPPPDHSPQLLRAWARLYAAGSLAADFPDCSTVLVTANPLGAEALREAAAKGLAAAGQDVVPDPLVRISLPRPKTTDQGFEEQIEALYLRGAALRQALAADQAPDPLELTAWEEAVAELFPGPCARLTWYCFHQVIPSRLLLEAFARQEDQDLLPSKDAPLLRLAVVEDVS
jgi:hypothetical protein